MRGELTELLALVAWLTTCSTRSRPCAGKFDGFEQCYPTIRVLLQCGHMSVAFAPYGQLCHAVAMGTGPEPRCVILLHVHDEMTELNPKNLRFDAAGFTGCRGYNPFMWQGTARDAGMGFEQSKSGKSSARNAMEMALRRLPRTVLPAPPRPTAHELRLLFVKLCFDFGPDETAPLLGDVVILTLMTSDWRLTLASEADVRLALMAELKASLSARYSEECRAGTWVGERAADAWLESCLRYAYYFRVPLSPA